MAETARLAGWLIGWLVGYSSCGRDGVMTPLSRRSEAFTHPPPLRSIFYFLPSLSIDPIWPVPVHTHHVSPFSARGAAPLSLSPSWLSLCLPLGCLLFVGWCLQPFVELRRSHLVKTDKLLQRPAPMHLQTQTLGPDWRSERRGQATLARAQRKREGYLHVAAATKARTVRYTHTHIHIQTTVGGLVLRVGSCSATQYKSDLLATDMGAKGAVSVSFHCVRVPSSFFLRPRAVSSSSRPLRLPSFPLGRPSFIPTCMARAGAGHDLKRKHVRPSRTSSVLTVLYHLDISRRGKSDDIANTR